MKADDVSRAYGEANPALTVAGVYGGPDFIVSGPAGDVLDFTPTLSTTADAGSDGGSYGITGSPNSAPSELGFDYRVVYSGELTVGSAPAVPTGNGTPTVPEIDDTPNVPPAVPEVDDTPSVPSAPAGPGVDLPDLDNGDGLGRHIECSDDGLLDCDLIEMQ